MRKSNLLVALLLLLVCGCITVSKEKKLDQYILNNPRLSEEIVSGMRSSNVIKGMNAQEVEFAWGKPHKVKKLDTGGDSTETVWYYHDKKEIANLDSSSLFAVDVPTKRVNFDNRMLVFEYKIYDEELSTSRIAAQGVLSGSMTADGKVICRAGEFDSWPTVTLTQIIETGKNGAAVLNGKIVGVGETVSGVKVLAVGSKGIKLAYKDQVGLLKKGESTK